MVNGCLIHCLAVLKTVHVALVLINMLGGENVLIISRVLIECNAKQHGPNLQ